MKTRVLAAMSGGVDSSVAAAILKGEGYDVTGVTMEIWSGEACGIEGRHHGCYGPGEKEDVEDAQKVAQILGIPLYIFDLREVYKAEVLDYVQREYLSGRTPNPCIRCNRIIKLGALIEKARDAGIEFDYFATGHYARIECDESRRVCLLKKAKDQTKDQSYFLSLVSKQQLGRLLLPLGDLSKDKVRELASELGLDVHDKPESQNFISGGYYSLFKADVQPGPILDGKGNILGQHKGIPYYTIGQRRGLGVSSDEAMYVTAIYPERNAIQIGKREELFSDELIASELNWIAVEGLDKPTRVKAKIRYFSKEAAAVLTPLDKDKVHVKFEEPQMAITPGQAVVFYDDDVVIGGGIIEE